MNTLLLVVTGAPGAGKSSFVRAISEIGVVDTDRTATDQTAQIKRATTVAMDYGHLSIGRKLHLHLYGTPGQSRFDFMWDFLIQRAHAYILLVAAHRPQDFVKAKDIVAFINERVNIPLIVGVTHLDCSLADSPDEIMRRLGFSGEQPLVTSVNASDKTSISAALYLCVISQLLQQQSQPQSAASGRPAAPRRTAPPLRPAPIIRADSPVNAPPSLNDLFRSINFFSSVPFTP